MRNGNILHAKSQIISVYLIHDQRQTKILGHINLNQPLMAQVTHCCYFLIIIKFASVQKQTSQQKMKTKITKSFLIFQNDSPLRESIVIKKSKWLKNWRSRKMVLYSNRIVFYCEGENKPKPSNVVYISDLTKIQDTTFCSTIKLHSTGGQFEIKFQSRAEKQSWIDDIKQAARTYQMNRSSGSEAEASKSNHICPDSLFCLRF